MYTKFEANLCSSLRDVEKVKKFTLMKTTMTDKDDDLSHTHLLSVTKN